MLGYTSLLLLYLVFLFLYNRLFLFGLGLSISFLNQFLLFYVSIFSLIKLMEQRVNLYLVMVCLMIHGFR